MKSIAALSVSVVLGVIVISLFSTPLIGGFTEDHTYTYNNGGQTNEVRSTLLEISSEDDLTVSCVEGVLTVGDDTLSTVSWYAVNIASDAFNIRRYTSTGYGLVTPNGNLGNYSNFMINIADGIATISAGSHTVTHPITWLAYQDPNGDYAIALSENATRVLYYSDINTIRGANFISTTQEWYSFSGLNVTVGDESITASLENVQTLAGDGHSFVYSSTLGDYTFIVDNNGEDYTVHPWVFVVPYEISVVSSSDKAIINLFGLIPLMLILSLVISIPTYALKSRWDEL